MKSLIYASFGLALLGAGAFLSSSRGSAAGLHSMPPSGLQNPALHQVLHGRCAAWRRVCGIRWSRGWRFRRCMTIHACLP